MDNSEQKEVLKPEIKKPKICCACPETRKLRDECVIIKSESECKKEIEDHKICLRLLGFEV